MQAQHLAVTTPLGNTLTWSHHIQDRGAEWPGRQEEEEDEEEEEEEDEEDCNVPHCKQTQNPWPNHCQTCLGDMVQITCAK